MTTEITATAFDELMLAALGGSLVSTDERAWIECVVECNGGIVEFEESFFEEGRFMLTSLIVADGDGAAYKIVHPAMVKMAD